MKETILSLLFALLLIGTSVIFKTGSVQDDISDNDINNVSIVDGKQIIEISAKGGYSPRQSTAKSGVPTVIRVSTSGTFDCSSAIMLPAIGYRSNLPPSGTVDIEVPPQKAGDTLQGLCSMGMYNFLVKFN
jgi:plastocyanin domain-containing protein